jgi:N-acetylglucosaminyl-diphospho-decaprenol L-rhamnosyltransferase
VGGFNVSLVSHGHGGMVPSLVKALLSFEQIDQITITNNLLEDTDYPTDPRICLIKNELPAGYGTNHNAAFRESKSSFFCILNPDIRFKRNPFPELISSFSNPKVALVAPKIITPLGKVEDSARKFPTFRSLFSKAFCGSNGTYSELNSSPDWVGGMFMLFRSDVFREIGGFDEKFFLYYEDVDICWRLRQKGYEIKFVPTVEVIHDARRESRKNWRYARWHLASMARYLIKAKAWW